MYLCGCVPPLRKMALRPPSLLIPALPGPSLGTAYQAPSTPLKVKSNLCLVAPPSFFFFFAFSVFLLPFMSLHSFLSAFGFFSFFFFTFLLFAFSILTSSYVHQISSCNCSHLPHHFICTRPYSLIAWRKWKQILLILYMEQERGMCINICILTFLCYCGLVNFSGTLLPPQRQKSSRWHIAEPQLHVFPLWVPPNEF